MAPRSRYPIILLICCLAQLLTWRHSACASDQRPVPNNLQKQVLHNTFKALLNYQKQTPVANGSKSPENVRYRSRSMLVAAKYMKELFQRYRSNAVITKTQGNIVRSMSPTIGQIDRDKVLKFNLNAIGTQEAVIKAELHYHYGLRRRRSRRTPICLLVSPSGQRTEIKQVAWDQSGQWIAYDVRNAVVAAVQLWSSQPKDKTDSGDSSPSLAVAFVGDSLLLPYKAKYYSPEKVLRNHAPFLLIHSEETQLIDRKQMLSAVLVDSDPERKEGNDTAKVRKKRSTSDEQYFAYAVADDQRTEPTVDEERLVQQVRQFQEQGPAVLQPMRSGRRRGGHYRNNRFESNPRFERKRQPFGTKTINDNRSVRQKTDRPQSSSTDKYATVVLLSGTPPARCDKHNLLVDFRDIGWGDQIIAPKTFEAHYCAGSCHFPLTWTSNPSNHAIIQSIIHTIGLQSNVPQVCCSPDKMDSLTLLYFDEDQNVVLKTYPKMVVTSCGCL